VTFYRKKYRYDAGSFPASHAWGQGTISLPLYLSLTRQEQDHVISVVKNKIVPLMERMN
jgi:UDP-4-amino-4-deoxy-L-arabinose-oxoglutarate aminotransferase